MAIDIHPINTLVTILPCIPVLWQGLSRAVVVFWVVGGCGAPLVPSASRGTVQGAGGVVLAARAAGHASKTRLFPAWSLHEENDVNWSMTDTVWEK